VDAFVRPAERSEACLGASVATTFFLVTSSRYCVLRAQPRTNASRATLCEVVVFSHLWHSAT